MSYSQDLQNEPWRFDFFDVLRRLERAARDKPRIGNSASLREEFVQLGMNPYMDFPASTLSQAERKPDGRMQIRSKFLGLLGPQGALPYGVTEEVYSWWLMRDEAFPRFLDLLHHRFLQLFFRAWADARPIAQHDRPDLDRFLTYLGSTIGLGSGAYRDLDAIPDAAKAAFAGIMMPQAKSASRLRSVIGGLFGVRVEIDQFVGLRLPVPGDERTRMGRKNCALGVDAMMGAFFFSLQDKFRIRIYTETLAEYERFLPGGNPDEDRCEALVDLVYFYIGDQLDWDVELAIAVGAVAPVRLGQFGRLGWTTWMSPNWSTTEKYRFDSRFHPAERIREKRKKAAAG